MSLVGYNPWACKELDMTEQLTHTCIIYSLVIQIVLFYGYHILNDIGRGHDTLFKQMTVIEVMT